MTDTDNASIDSEATPKRVGDLLRRHLDREFTHAHARLAKSDALRAADIHEARKSLRRLRAWLRWSKRRKRPQIAALNDELKAIRDQLSPVRDAGAMVESIARLQQRKMGPALGAEFDTWKDPLTRSADTTLRQFASSPFRSSLAKRIALAHAALDSVPSIGKGQIRRGLAASTKRALHAAATLPTLTDAEARHNVRRSMRLLNLQLQQAQALGRLQGMTALLQPCDRLTKSLGLESDLMVLLNRAASPRQRCSSALAEWLQRQRGKRMRRSNKLAKALLTAAA